MINYRLKIDFLDSKTMVSDICFVSGDVKSSALNFEFYNDGKRVDISDYTLSVRAKRSDGVVIASLGKIKDNTAIFIPENNFYAVPGELYMEIALSDSTGKYVTTKIITAEVLEGLGKNAIEGEDNLNVYVKLVNEAVSAKDKAEAAAEVAKKVHPKIVDGVWWVYDYEEGTLVSSGITAEGPQGIQGEKGNAGADGYSPVKGVDYYTDDEKREIINEVLKETSTKYANALKGSASGEIVSIKGISPVEHNVGVKISSKNLIPYPYAQTTRTQNGLTFTDNVDGSITVNGTAEKTTYFLVGANEWASALPIEAGTYTFSGCPEGGSTTTYSLGLGTRASENATRAVTLLHGDAKSVTITGGRFDVSINIYEGAVLDNVVFKPQLEKGSIATDYTPYVPDVSVSTLSATGKNLANKENIIKYGTLRKYLDVYLPAGSYYYSSNLHAASGVAFWTGIGSEGELSETNYIKRFSVFAGTEDRGSFTITESGTYRFLIYCDYSNNFNALEAVWDNVWIQIEKGTTATEYEPYIEHTYPVLSDGTAEGVKSIYPNTTLLTDTQGVVIECEYNKDINKAFAELQNAIISLGGNV